MTCRGPRMNGLETARMRSGRAARRATGWPGGRRWRSVRQGFERRTASTLTDEMHSVPTGRRCGMSTSADYPGNRMRTLTFRLHRVSTGVGPGFPHRNRYPRSLGGRGSPLKFTARRLNAGERYPHGFVPVSSIRRSFSPFGRIPAAPLVHHAYAAGTRHRLPANAGNLMMSYRHALAGWHRSGCG